MQERHYNQEPSRRRMRDAQGSAASGAYAASGRSANRAAGQRRQLTDEERQALAERRAARRAEYAQRETGYATSGQTRARQRVSYDATDRQRITYDAADQRVDYGATRMERGTATPAERIAWERGTATPAERIARAREAAAAAERAEYDYRATDRGMADRSDNAAYSRRRRAIAEEPEPQVAPEEYQEQPERLSAQERLARRAARRAAQEEGAYATYESRSSRAGRASGEGRASRSSRRAAAVEDAGNAEIQLSGDRQASVDMFRNGAIMAFAGILVLGALIGLLFFARPSASAFEKRNLTEFPKPTVATFLNGEFFSDVSLWYSDTYPLRELLVKANQGIKSHYGLHADTMMVGGNVQADELPVDVEESKKEKKKKKHTKVEAPNEEAMAADIQDQIMSGLYIENGAAYSIYYFVQDAVDLYTEALSMAADELEGEANVYSMLVPNNSIMLDDATMSDLGGTDQVKALQYFDGMYSENVTSIFFLEALREHRGEYLYFRTDHHWTQLGAYYAYEQFCKEKGIDPIPLEDRESQTIDGFLGSYYSELGLGDMENNPDTVTAYIPNGTNDMTIYDSDNSELSSNVIQDVTGWDRGSYYSTFIGGDQSLEVIENPKITDGSSCLLIKDSYGCAFAPLLVDHYQTLYIIDFRYSDRNIVDFVRKHSIDDVIFMNNLSLATTSTVGDALYSEIEGWKSEKSEKSEGAKEDEQ